MVAFGFTRRPHNIIINSYHHHSRQTETQVGIASASNEDHPLMQFMLGETHDSLYTPEKYTNEDRKRMRLRLVKTSAIATPAIPIFRVTLDSWLRLSDCTYAMFEGEYDFFCKDEGCGWVFMHVRLEGTVGT
ncbi:hypothetical protein Lal_00025526 [Lupinus albus]|nr:hypothetical protein Lal_00025526 [Lupinus albus]